MGWFKWRRAIPTPVVPVVPAPEPEEAEPERPSMLERFAHWRAVVALQAQVEPTVDEVEQERARQEQARAARIEDQIAQMIAVNGGSYFPGDEVGSARRPESWPGDTPGVWWTRL